MAHQHYKGTGQMHSFRGLLGDGKQEKIRIEGATGEIAWRITKFHLLPNDPAGSAGEFTVKIYRENQSSITGVIDFTEDELLAAGFFSAGNSSQNYPQDVHVIFDNALFVRNIWISSIDSDASSSINYYIELEEVKVSAAGMAQLAVAASRRR